MTEVMDFPQVSPYPESVEPHQDNNTELAFQGIVKALDLGVASTETVKTAAVDIEVRGTAVSECLPADVGEVNDGEPDPDPDPKPEPEPDYPHKTTIGGDWIHSSRPLS